MVTSGKVSFNWHQNDISGACPESDPLPSAGVQTGEGDSWPPRGQGGPAGGPGDDRAGAGQHEPGNIQGLRHHQALAEDLDDQHSVQAEWEPDRLTGHHHLGSEEGETETSLASPNILFLTFSDGARDSRLGEGGQGGHQLRPGVSPQLHPAHRRQLEEPLLCQDVAHLGPAGHPRPEHPGPHLPAAKEGGESEVLQGDGLQGGRPHPAQGEGAEIQPSERGTPARQMCHLLGTRMGWLLWTDRIHNKGIIYLQGTKSTKTQFTNTNNVICKRFQLADTISNDKKMYNITFWHPLSVTGQAHCPLLAIIKLQNTRNVNIWLELWACWILKGFPEFQKKILYNSNFKYHLYIKRTNCYKANTKEVYESWSESCWLGPNIDKIQQPTQRKKNSGNWKLISLVEWWCKNYTRYRWSWGLKMFTLFTLTTLYYHKLIVSSREKVDKITGDNLLRSDLRCHTVNN